ncbi:hypothetical protein AC477_02030 [miscellaneous Crenarchaeota group-1 archaeon SG8-32-1]|uniref:Glycosyltransferase RgtA/B/C/D-like domain-containing protein n=1 Tax=miscellaneous Crenarchaeota group-1 archaeon SG8-32-1 TaxID=1685124 RepID=A0A0M0BXB3_9ARCH|nr:MAG: hypothetical protein AC477_02030 [miscellaneous Crenarchaeota group-1 archaeon SG8-32-1]
MSLKAGLLALLFCLAIGAELLSYSLPIVIARIVLLVSFLAMLCLIMLMHKFFADSQSPYRKLVVFSVFFVISILFVLRRFLLLLPSRIELVVTSEIFAVAEKMGSSGFISFNNPHSFIFQPSFFLNFLRESMGLTFSQVFYITLLIQAIIIAFAGMFLYELLRKKFDGKEKGYAFYLLPPLLAFSLISFACSERADIGLSLFLLLMCVVYAKGLTSRGMVVVMLLLVLGITFSSSTAILIMIPFFFAYSIFSREPYWLFLGLIPLSYVSFAGHSYLSKLEDYLVFTNQGIGEFLRQFFSGQISERLSPLGRVVLPIASDIRVTSMAYISLLIVALLISISALFILFKLGMLRKIKQNAFFVSVLFVTVIALVIAFAGYVGASVLADTTFSDIRTIAIVFVTLLLPFLFLSKPFLKNITKHRIVVFIIAALLVFASLRTFYEIYPISSSDPVNLVEDPRMDAFAISNARDFLQNAQLEGSVAFDYKTGIRIAHFLSEDLELMTFTTELPKTNYLVFDMNGLEFGSLHTSEEVYEAAIMLSLNQSANVIYNDGAVMVVHLLD